jgi:hypothetical protein
LLFLPQGRDLHILTLCCLRINPHVWGHIVVSPAGLRPAHHGPFPACASVLSSKAALLMFLLQGRDLRIMDPSLATSYPSAILCREKALVISLEHIKVRPAAVAR